MRGALGFAALSALGCGFLGGDGPRGAWVDVATSSIAACAVTSRGDPACWGLSAPSFDGPIAALSAGETHLCALDPQGDVRCAVVLGGQEFVFAGGNGYTAIASGDDAACALVDGGAAHCSGGAPLVGMDPPGGDFVDIAVGTAHGCLLGRDGGVACWGPDGPVIDDAPADAVQIAVGDGAACALDDRGALTCWGEGAVADAPSGTFRDLSVAGGGACAIDGGLVCWGDAPEPPSGGFRQVSLGFGSGCGIRSGGALECWGTVADEAEPP